MRCDTLRLQSGLHRVEIILNRIAHIASWEPEGRYCRSKMFRWEPEGRNRHTLCTAIAPFWFSTEHIWAAITPFWLSTDDMHYIHLAESSPIPFRFVSDKSKWWRLPLNSEHERVGHTTSYDSLRRVATSYRKWTYVKRTTFVRSLG